VNPDTNAAILNINGKYEQSDQGTLHLDLFSIGATPGLDFDRLAVTGTVKLAGTLSIQFANPITPQLGDSFRIVTSGEGISGQFSQIVAPSLDPGLSWSILYTPAYATLRVVQQTSSGGPLDYLTRWQQSFGLNGAADLNGDGITDGADFLIWQLQAFSTGATHAVPEPATLSAMLVAATIGLLTRGTSRR
jgi:hypothetical protein